MLKNIIEALFFSAGRGLSLEELATFFEDHYKKEEIKDAIAKIKQKYSKDKGIILIEYNDKYEFQSNPQYGEIITDILKPVRERELSKALLETLAIIAYKQPATRLDIEEIRGVSSDYAVSMLLKFNLITIVGKKDALGRPLLYGTTDEFLRRFQLKSLEELPEYQELIESIKNSFDTYYQASENLYRKDLTNIDITEKVAATKDEESFEIDEDDIPDFLQDQAKIIQVE